jgi:aldehyde:ferredoxin oxidoreductase
MFIGASVDIVRQFYAAYFGEEFDPNWIADYGWQILAEEWEFNRRAGFTPKDNDLPDCMKTDAIGAGKDLVFSASAETIAAVFERCVTGEELCEGIATG